LVAANLAIRVRRAIDEFASHRLVVCRGGQTIYGFLFIRLSPRSFAPCKLQRSNSLRFFLEIRVTDRGMRTSKCCVNATATTRFGDASSTESRDKLGGAPDESVTKRYTALDITLGRAPSRRPCLRTTQKPLIKACEAGGRHDDDAGSRGATQRSRAGRKNDSFRGARSIDRESQEPRV